MKKQWKLDNKGMTLLEVIVAFAIFAIAATILISYFGGALRIIGNSNALKDASQKGTSDLEMSDLDSEEEKTLGKNVKKVSGNVKIWKDETTYNNDTATSQYMVSGNFFTATEKKNNDQTEVLQQVFKPNANSGFTPKPIDPVDPEIKDINYPTENEAYYNSGQLSFHFITPNTGNFDKSFFSEYERINKKSQMAGVVKNTESFQGDGKGKRGEIVQEPDSNIQQLYFVNDKPFAFGEQSGKISYAVKLIYIGKTGNKTNITTNIVLNDEGTDIDRVNRFILNSYENANTILYLPEDMVISAKVICYNPAVNKVYNQVTLPKGFYSVPNDTDLLEIVYDEKKHAEFLSYKTEFTKNALEELGIKLF